MQDRGDNLSKIFNVCAIFVALVGLFGVQTANSKSVCSEAVRHTLIDLEPKRGPGKIRYEKHHELVMSLLARDPEKVQDYLDRLKRDPENTGVEDHGPEFEVTAHVRDPKRLIKSEDGRSFDTDYYKPHLTLFYRFARITEDWRLLIKKFLGYHGPSGTFHDKVFANYEGKFPREILNVISLVERLLADESNMNVLVEQLTGPYQNINKPVATLRASYGSARFGLNLPFEIYYWLRGVKSKAAEWVAELRRKNPEQDIFELGRFTKDNLEEFKEPDQKRIIGLLILAVFDRIVLRHPDAIFLSHVAGRATLRYDQQEWGWRVLDSQDVKNTDPKTGKTVVVREYVLILTAEELKKVIMKRLGLSVSDLQYHPN